MESERRLRADLAANPGDADAWFALGEILFRAQRPTESLQALDAGGRLRATRAVEDRLGALDYVLLGDYALAQRLLERSLQKAPRDSVTLYYLGRALYAQNRPAPAIARFQEALRLDPANLRTLDNLALALAAEHREKEAEATFHTAINLPNAKEQLFLLADYSGFLYEVGRQDEALDLLKLADVLAAPAAEASDLGRAEALLGKIELARSLPVEAVGHLQRAIDLIPEDAASHFLLGRAYAATGDKVKAASEFARFRQLNDRPAPVR